MKRKSNSFLVEFCIYYYLMLVFRVISEMQKNNAISISVSCFLLYYSHRLHSES